MKRMKHFLWMTTLVLATLFFVACDKEEDPLTAWESEIEQLKAATNQYLDFSVAEAAGFIDVSGYVPNMGHHYLNPALSDGIFELEKPEIILYLPDANGKMQMAGVEYSIVPDDPNDPGSPPEGFTGDQDEWHFNELIGQWQLHVWTILDNPDGIFAPHNPAIGD